MVDGRCAGRSSRRGSVLLVALIAVMVVAALASAMLIGGSSRDRARDASLDETRALYVAEAGMSAALAAAFSGTLGNLGAQNAPLAFGGGEHWVTAVDNGDDTATVTAWGRYGGALRCTEAMLESSGAGIYDYALFAGNSSGDPGYDMRFGGTGASSDDIDGNVYSGGNVVVAGDAHIDGAVRANGTVSAASTAAPDTPQTGVSVPIPNLAAMAYETNHDFNVAAMFATATWSANALGGSAFQLPESSPAHIFRKNPSDRATDNAGTAKDDYYLEDPYETVNSSSTIAAASSTRISLSGTNGKPGVSGTNKVYFIDGNLWVHNRKLFSFALASEAANPARITLVVKGNVYFSDNIIYQDPARDGVAFVALKDAAHADSGNIYFGDPTFGTLERMDAFMYAENNFYDNNLSASGSARVTVNGNMTAGNQVRINRDFGGAHSKLEVNYDPRLVNGSLTLPGLPGFQYSGSTWELRSWREVGAHP